MKYRVRYEDSNNFTKDLDFTAENDMHAYLKVIHMLIKPFNCIKDIETYPVRIKQDFPEIDLYDFPVDIVSAYDYIYRNRNKSSNFIYCIKNLSEHSMIYPAMN